MRTKLIFTMLIVLAFVCQMHAQTLTGTIKEADTKLEIIGAAIVVKGTSKGTVSDFEGNFKITVTAGAGTLEVSFLGFITKEVTYEVKAGETKDIGEILLEANSIGLEELKVVASYAVDRQTPVAISKIDPILIEEKLGSQEFPEILKSTPSVYVTKTGGGYGDAEIRLRGFSSENIGVLINGVPVNDMENGKVYWSNWAGLSEVTRSMQVQRGLGASKLAISSVGGTINIITNSTDVEKGGVVFYGMGNDNYMKTAFTVSTGLMDKGWAISLSGAKTTGDGFVKATNFEGYSYFANISKRVSKKQQFSFTVFGAPQWHNQRGSKMIFTEYLNSPDGIKYNRDYGYRNGEIYNTGYAYNYYHKPQMSLNHFVKLNDNTKISTSVYASFGRGGGRRAAGQTSWITSDINNGGAYYEDAKLTQEGYYDYDAVIAENAASLTGSKVIISNSVNSHDWYGVLSSLNSKFGSIDITAGIDGRYYKGYHYTEIDDLLGGDYYLNSSNINRDPGTPLQVGDKYGYYNLGEVLWEGLFLQGEYVSDKISGFISVAGSNTSFRRTDYFLYLPGNQISEWLHRIGYSAKGGVNYNITDNFNIFANGGYFQRPPFMKYVFLNNTNTLNTGVKQEKVMTGEVGIGYIAKKLTINLNAYYTNWIDKAKTFALQDQTANVVGLNALHSGIELDLSAQPLPKLELIGMISVGNWLWDKNASATFYDENDQLIGTQTVYASDLHVGGSAQTTAALGMTWEIFPKFKIGADYNYYDRLFAEFDIEQRTTTVNQGIDAWLMPNYNLFDCNASYKFDIGKLKATLTGKVNNILNTEYFSDARDGNNHDAFTSPIYFGAGRTYSIGLKLKF